MQRRPLGDVLAIGALAGLLGGFATGLCDAIWSWGPAAQFVPGGAARLRFVLYTGLSLAATGALVGVVAAMIAVGLARGTRLGEVVRFGWRDHEARRARDPRDAVVGLSLVLAGVPLLAAAIAVVYRVMTPVVVKSHALGLAVLAVIAATLVALGVAFVLTFVVGRIVELALRPLASRVHALASPWAPLVAAAVLVAIACALWAWAKWDVARLLPLRRPLVVAIGVVLAVPARGPAHRTLAAVAALAPWLRRAVWLALPLVLVVLVLDTGGSAAVIKASSRYTGLGAPIARGVRTAFDRDRDGYSRFLGGGDCDDGDAAVHPGAPEIPDDGIDQNCVAGDASLHRGADDVAFASVPANVPKDANILLITIDTARADHFGMYGYKRATSPNLDAVAAQGAVFESGWAHAPSTRYSMPAILTGRLPLDVYYDTSIPGWPGILPKATTLGEALAPLGFVTGAITNYSYFERARHMDQGFAEYDNENHRLHGEFGKGPARTKGSSSKEQTDKAIAFVERHADKRWFLWVHYYDPHADYEPHAEVPSFGNDEIALYDGEIRFTDFHIGRLLDALRAKGSYDKTIVVMTGDHGEGFGEHRVFKHGYDLYSPQTKVPFMIRVPGLAPRRAKTPAGHVDLMPTLVNLAGGSPDPDMMGRSLVDVLAGAEHADRVVFQQLSYEGNHELRAGVDTQCHVIYNVSPETSWEVYRVDRDPLETRDLVGDEGACTRTRRAVERWYDTEQVPLGAAEALLPARPAIAAPVDADLDGSVRLLAVDVPASAKPGDAITLTWTFEARARVAPSWRLFVHVKGPNNAFLNGDHKPARPFEWWRPGQFIRYSTTLTLPRHVGAGTYTVWVGLFEGNRRAKAIAPRARIDNNAVAAVTFEVAP